MMKRSLSSLLALCALATAGTPAWASGRIVERVVAVVNEEPVLESEVDQSAFMSMKASGAEIDFDTAAGRRKWDELKHKALDELIDERLVLQQAIELKLSVTSEQVDRAIEDVKQQNGLTDSQFREALKQQGFSLESYRKQIRRQILELQVKNIAVGSRVNVSEDEVKQAYEQEVGKVKPEMRYRLQIVLVAVSPKATDDDNERKRKVADKVTQLARSGTSFAELVKSYSDDELTKAEAGDLGYLAKDDMVDAVAEEVDKMASGDVRGPVRTGRGWQVLKLVDKKQKDVPSIDGMRDQLRRKLFAQQLERVTQSWLKELRRKAHLDIRY